MLQEVRGILGEQADATGAYPQTVWTDQYLLDGMNYALLELGSDQIWPLQQTDATARTVAGQNYVLAPANLSDLLKLYVGEVAPGLEYTPVGSDKFFNLVAGTAYCRMGQTAGASENKIYIYPTPTSTNQVITIEGIFRHPRLVSTTLTATVMLPDNYYPYLIWASVCHARIREEDSSMLSVAQRERDKFYTLLWQDLTRSGAQQTMRMKHPSEVPR